MCFPVFAAVPALVSAAAGGAAAAAGSAAGTFLGIAGSTWGAISTGAGLLGAGVSAIGQAQQGKAESEVAKQNAVLAKQRELDAQRRGSVAEGQQRTQYQRFVGTQRAIMGASGVVADTGSSADVTLDTVDLGERAAQQLRENAAREAWGFANEASIYKYQSMTARQTGMYKAGATFLGGSMDVLRDPPWWKKQWAQNP